VVPSLDSQEEEGHGHTQVDQVDQADQVDQVEEGHDFDYPYGPSLLVADHPLVAGLATARLPRPARLLRAASRAELCKLVELLALDR